MIRKKFVRLLSGTLGASLVAGMSTMAVAAPSASAATTQSFSQTYQLSCTAPIVGALTVPLTITGTAPTSVTAGQTFFITNAGASMTIPGNAIGDATSLLKATAITITASQFVVTDNGSPASVDLGAAPFGPLTSASTPISGSNPVTVAVPATPIPQVGPVTPPSSGTFNAFPGAATADISFTTPTGTSDLGNATCTAPTNPPAMVSIPVGGSGPPPPVVTSIAPAGGPAAGGTTVTITGTGFTGATAVDFGGVPGTSLMAMGDTSIMATSPAGTPGSIVDVTVVTPNGTSATGPADQFTYANTPPPVLPTVTGVSPSSGPTSGGNYVTITGTGFTGATAVNFGSTPASYSVSSATSITAMAPKASAGTVDVTVTNANGTSTPGSADQYTYTTPTSGAPVVKSIFPNVGPSSGGGIAFIFGSNFAHATSVTFGTKPGLFLVVGNGLIIAIAPKNAKGKVTVTVTGPGGSSTGGTNAYTYF